MSIFQSGSAPDPRRLVQEVMGIMARAGWTDQVHPEIKKSGTGIMSFVSLRGRAEVAVTSGEFITAYFVDRDGNTEKYETLDELRASA